MQVLLTSFATIMMRLMDKTRTSHSELLVSRKWSEDAMDMFNTVLSLIQDANPDIGQLAAHKFIKLQNRLDLRWFVHLTLLTARHEIDVPTERSISK